MSPESRNNCTRFRVRAGARPQMCNCTSVNDDGKLPPKIGLFRHYLEGQPVLSGPCQAGPEPVAMARFRDLCKSFRKCMRHRRASASFEGPAKNAPVAQLDRALDYESRGQEFESLRARQHLARVQLPRFAGRFAKSVSKTFSNLAMALSASWLVRARYLSKMS